MSKKLRYEPIYIAPEIMGWLDMNGNPLVLDERYNIELDPRNSNHKILIYERQVFDWFLLPALDLIKFKNKNKGFIVLMLCLSYLEGVEQYKRGESSNRKSKEFFTSSIKKLYPQKFNDHQLKTFYSEARCGLFHNGMVQGKIIINNRFSESLNFEGNDIKVSPSKFLKDIIKDFQDYVQLLKTDETARNLFATMYSNI
jgi:hypothetical protein